MTTRDELLASIAETITDYRDGDLYVPAMNAKHVDTWIRQFDDEVQIPMLQELDHVFDQAYCNRATADRWLTSLATNKKLAGGDPATFWSGCGFLDIQGGGDSQTQMLELFDKVLVQEVGLGLNQCKPTTDTFIYIDDAIFSGTRVRNDLVNWITNTAPDHSTVNVIVIALFSGGHWHASSKLKETIKKSGKTVDIHWWRAKELLNTKSRCNVSDVLWPKRLPDDQHVKVYAQALTDAGYPPENSLRGGRDVGDAKLFSSAAGRDLLEQEFLKAGARIRSMCGNLPRSLRPLGFTGLRTLGFGSMVVTYRNCPNTCPLALWVGDPWYPLFPRRTNSETAWGQ